MEGVLCNCFPIVSDIDANRELLGNHAMYLNLHDDIDMKSVFSRCVKLIDSNQYRCSIEYNRDTIIKMFDINKNTKRMVDIYYRVVSQKEFL